MQVPTLTSQKVAAGQGQLAYTQGTVGAGGLGAGLASALQGLGSNLQALGERTAQLNDKTDRFNAIKNYNDWQTHMDEKTVEMKRDYRADGKGFADHYMAQYEKESLTFLKDQVPEHLRDEWRAKMSEDRQAMAAKALSFQYEASDKWFKVNINDAYQKAQATVAQTPATIDAELARVSQLVDASDLSEDDKALLKHNIDIGLNGIKYKQDVKDHKTLPVGEITDDEAGAAAILRKEEGLVLKPIWDVNHTRIGYSSDTITQADGTIRRTTKNDVVTKEDAERDLARRVRSYKNDWIGEVGAETWNALPAKARAALISVTYNYGFDKKDLSGVIAAVKGGNTEEVAREVGQLSANPGRRAKEAAIIRGTGSIDTDPRYDKIPFDTRVQLREQAERELLHDQAQEASLRKQRDIALRNELQVGLHDGTKGLEHVKQGREEGWLTDYDDIIKAEKIYNDRMKGLNDAKTASERLDSGIPFGTSKEDNDQINALVAQNDGIQKIVEGDPNHFPLFANIVNKTSRVPTEIRGILQTMVNGADWKQGIAALDTLERIRSINGDAFATSMPEQIQDKVQMYSVLKGQVEGKQLIDRINGGMNAEERQATTVLRKEGRDLLKSMVDQAAVGRTLFTEVIKGFDDSYMPWESNPAAPAYAPQHEAMYSEFSEVFIEKYAKFRDKDMAQAATIEHLKRTWGVSEIGGAKVVMRLPPGAVGYPKFNGDHDWMNKEIRKTLNLNPDARFQLFSDDNTQQEFNASRLNPDGMVRSPIYNRKTPGMQDPGQEYPSYKVILFDEMGTPTGFAKNPETGKDLRVWVKPPPAEVQRQKVLYDKQADMLRLQTEIRDYEFRKLQMEDPFNPSPYATIDPTEHGQYEAAKKRVEELQKEIDDVENADPEIHPTMDSLGGGGGF